MSLLSPSTPPAAPAATGPSAPAVAPGDDRPYTPITLPDLDSLSPAARHEFRQAIRNGSRESFEAWGQKWAQPNAAVAAGNGANPLPAAGTPPAPDMSPALAQVAAKLEQHGSHLDAVKSLAHPMRQFEDRLSFLNDEEMAETFRVGEETILRQHYRGSEGAYDGGLREIGQAASKIGIDPGQLYDSGVLSDPDLHLRILGMARAINKGLPA
jgi:hypothetical protein